MRNTQSKRKGKTAIMTRRASALGRLLDDVKRSNKAFMLLKLPELTALAKRTGMYLAEVDALNHWAKQGETASMSVKAYLTTQGLV